MLPAEVCFVCRSIDFVFMIPFAVHACLHIAHTCVLQK